MLRGRGWAAQTSIVDTADVRGIDLSGVKGLVVVEQADKMCWDGKTVWPGEWPKDVSPKTSRCR